VNVEMVEVNEPRLEKRMTLHDLKWLLNELIKEHGGDSEFFFDAGPMHDVHAYIRKEKK
jgi:hypothetical protein